MRRRCDSQSNPPCSIIPPTGSVGWGVNLSWRRT
jgi:hypothetical protein